MEGDRRSRSPRLLVLGAGPAQLGLLERARARGLWLAVVDRDPAAPGLRLADRRCILSIEDEPAIDRLVGALSIDGIVAPGTDWPIGAAARIAERGLLPHPVTPRTAVLATNKLRQRERLDEAGVPQPKWHVVGVGDAPPEPAFPCVVKAPDSQGQRGLTLVETPSELECALTAARKESRGNLALVEELVPGPEVTVIGFSARGTYHALAVTDRVVGEPPAFGVALAHVWPSESGRDAATVAERAAAALEIIDGPSYIQLRLADDGPRVIEVAARLGGGHDAELVEAATGVPLNDLAIDAALGRPLDVPVPTARVGGAVTRFLVAPPGVLEQVEVPDGLEGVEQVRIYREPGYELRPLRRGADRAGAVLAVGGSRAEALDRADRAAAAITFRVEGVPVAPR
ncbi:MAG TPA: ATP-grasp domain-containing protein [Gaiellaceae bacterium]|nr:ATP-grasp domain-containing protein [Gaiellaceae bacterium]